MSFKLHWKEAFVVGMLVWMLGLVEHALFQELERYLISPPLSDIIFFLIFIIMAWAAVKLYFGARIASWSEAASVAATFVAIGFLLDLVFAVPLIFTAYSPLGLDYVLYFTDWRVWTYHAIVFSVTVLAGALGVSIKVYHRKI